MRPSGPAGALSSSLVMPSSCAQASRLWQILEMALLPTRTPCTATSVESMNGCSGLCKQGKVAAASALYSRSAWQLDCFR